MDALDEILAKLTPDRLERLILAVADRQEPGERAGVDVSSIISHVVTGHDLGIGAERSQAYRRLIETIRTNVALIEGVKYVKSSD
jgi:predicted metal-dependent HD superfamily phosphohydrolase